jgi:hypothetical protein
VNNFDCKALQFRTFVVSLNVPFFFECRNPKIRRNIYAAQPDGFLPEGKNQSGCAFLYNSKLLHLLIESKFYENALMTLIDTDNCLLITEKHGKNKNGLFLSELWVQFSKMVG